MCEICENIEKIWFNSPWNSLDVFLAGKFWLKMEVSSRKYMGRSSITWRKMENGSKRKQFPMNSSIQFGDFPASHVWPEGKAIVRLENPSACCVYPNWSWGMGSPKFPWYCQFLEWNIFKQKWMILKMFDGVFEWKILFKMKDFGGQPPS